MGLGIVYAFMLEHILFWCLLFLVRIYLHTKFYLENCFGKERIKKREEKDEKAYLVNLRPRPSQRPPRGPASFSA